eukprot:357752-Chlamydomonas_euryale.AAC.3
MGTDVAISVCHVQQMRECCTSVVYMHVHTVMREQPNGLHVETAVHACMCACMCANACIRLFERMPNYTRPCRLAMLYCAVEMYQQALKHNPDSKDISSKVKSLQKLSHSRKAAAKKAAAAAAAQQDKEMA